MMTFAESEDLGNCLSGGGHGKRCKGEALEAESRWT